uniref:ATP-dependent RNA helicase n=1 Tax=Graphocephala atropunctata TaxID=36148 RepID=A0A1B6KQB4_9HEMI
MTGTKSENNKKVKVFHKKKNTNSVDKIIKTLEDVEIDISTVESFEDLPLSPPTLKGLTESGYKKPTEIQKESLVLSLKGLDILGAAKTGSGKTLAFLIPVLEILFKKKWTRYDGVGALIITPTRELAYQIFETLRKVGFYHDFSAGLIIGGKDLHFEKHRMDRVNIVICTPGRLLQHMDENPLFDCVNSQVLVLDEADRCLDLGFEKTMNSIIENLPLQRQTLLFSATQTKSVKDLARLSLKNPKYVLVHEHSQYSTPEGLTQNFVVCELHEKMAMLWSFLKNHHKHKILVFLSSCKQVKYIHEMLCKLRPPIALLALYGTLHQERRMNIYNSFADKQHAVLLATDIAARGLDFPEVNWVVQLDCPEDANTYIHRAGRTARYQKGGESLLVLLPSEKEAMLKHLEEKKIPINEIKINPTKLTSPHVKMEAFLARNSNLKESAQRAFVSYFKSVFLMKDKKVFDVSALDPEAYARSLGLVVSPRIRFLQKHQKGQLKNMKKVKNEVPSNEIGNLTESESESQNSDLVQQPLKMQREEILSRFAAGNVDSDEELLVNKNPKDSKTQDLGSDEDENENPLTYMTQKFTKKPITSKDALLKKMLKNNCMLNKKIVFSDDKEVLADTVQVETAEGENNAAVGRDITIREAAIIMKAEDKNDIKCFREKVKVKHREEKLKEKKLKKKQERDEEVDAYSGNESEESEPDLSWLPDPDKVYGKNTDSENSEGESQDERDSPESSSESEGKRKRKDKEWKSNKKVKVSHTTFDDEPLSVGASLKEDEELVLKFLSSKR